MFTFVARFVDEHQGDLLAELARQVRGCLPRVETELQLSSRSLPEVGGGWVLVRPTASERRPRLTETVEDDLAVLALGTTSAEVLSASVLQRYREGGIAAVRALEGCFSALIVDRTRGRVLACGDIIGTRSMRFVRTGVTITLSMNDALLSSCAGIRAELDAVSAASVLLCDWSLGGHPLLQGVTPIDADHYLHCGRDRCELVRDSFLDDTQRVAERDRAAITGVIEEVDSTLRDTLARDLALEAPERVRFSLTAGVDSRAVLSLLLATGVAKERLVAGTSGADASVDVRWARRICRLLDIEHETSVPSMPSGNAFERNVQLLAFVANGDTNAKRALSEMQDTAPAAPSVGGMAGEIFRGYYYPYYRRRALLGRPPPGDAAGIADLLGASLLASPARVPVHPELRAGVEQRLRDRLAGYARYATDAYGYLDCFYLRERYGVWASFSWRKLWMGTLAPFHCAGAIRAAARLPPPWGDRRIQAEIIRKHLPTLLYLMPANGDELLPMHGPGRLRFLLRDNVRRGIHVARALRPQRESQKSHERIRAELFASDVYEQVRECLLAPGSVSLQLMERQALVAMLEEHRRRYNRLQALGFLMTMEAWYRQLGRHGAQRE